MRKLYAAYCRSVMQTQCNPAGILIAFVVVWAAVVRYMTVIETIIHIATICLYCGLVITAAAGMVAGTVWLIRRRHQSSVIPVPSSPDIPLIAPTVDVPVASPALEVASDNGAYTYMLTPDGVERVDQLV